MKDRIVKLIRWTEIILKTDTKYLFSQGGWLISGQIIIFFFSFLLVWVFANYISPSDYGLYKYVVAIVTLASITTLTGFGVAITKAVAENHNIVIHKILKIQIRYGLIGVIALFIFAGYYLINENILLATLFVVSALWIPFFEPFANYQFILQGKKDFRNQTLFRIIQRIILTLILIGTIFYTKNIIIITGIYFASLTFSQLFVLILTIRKYPEIDDLTTPYGNIISYAKRLSMQNVFIIGVGQLDKVLLFKFLGPIQLATYYFAISLPNEIQGIIGNINSVAFPKLINKKGLHFIYSLLKKISVFTLLLLIPVCIYIIVAPYLFLWLFPVYIDAVLISQLYVGTVLFIPVSLLWQYFYATEHKRALWAGTIIGPSSLILGIICFAPIFGLLGAVMAVYLRAFIDLLMGLFFFLHDPNQN